MRGLQTLECGSAGLGSGNIERQRRQAKGDALAELIDKARHDAKAGRLPKGRKLALAFSDAASQYLAKLVQEDGKDLPMKGYRLNMHLTPFFGDTQLAKITTVDVERYKKQRGSELVVRPNGPRGKPSVGGEAKPATINRELAALSHLSSKAVEWGWVDHRAKRAPWPVSRA